MGIRARAMRCNQILLPRSGCLTQIIGGYQGCFLSNLLILNGESLDGEIKQTKRNCHYQEDCKQSLLPVKPRACDNLRSLKGDTMSKVLIVDDSPTMRNLVQSALRSEPYSFEFAEDGQQGLDSMGSFAPDIVIADINMPVMSGVVMISEIRKKHSKEQVPIVVLTTETSEEMKEKIRIAGANAWIAKPFADDVLCNVVRQFTR